MKADSSVIVRTPVLGRSVLLAFRARMALGYVRRPLTDALTWLFRSNETTNFTYDLDALNKRYLASLIADVMGTEAAIIEGYILELEQDQELRRHIVDSTARSELSFMADKEVRFGRRAGWYAIARALKPKVVVETGVDKGLGACVLTAALRRNEQEGSAGRYYGTDINPKAGYLLSGEYARFGTVLYGDSVASLGKLADRIDLFVNDSDHSAEYEYQEYLTVAGKLSERAIILGDNSHCTDRLLTFSRATHRHFVFFQERPMAHWYPGGGIGISFRR